MNNSPPRFQSWPRLFELLPFNPQKIQISNLVTKTRLPSIAWIGRPTSCIWAFGVNRVKELSSKMSGVAPRRMSLKGFHESDVPALDVKTFSKPTFNRTKRTPNPNRAKDTESGSDFAAPVSVNPRAGREEELDDPNREMPVIPKNNYLQQQEQQQQQSQQRYQETLQNQIQQKQRHHRLQDSAEQKQGQGLVQEEEEQQESYTLSSSEPFSSAVPFSQQTSTPVESSEIVVRASKVFAPVDEDESGSGHVQGDGSDDPSESDDDDGTDASNGVPSGSSVPFSSPLFSSNTFDSHSGGRNQGQSRAQSFSASAKGLSSSSSLVSSTQQASNQSSKFNPLSLLTSSRMSGKTAELATGIAAKFSCKSDAERDIQRFNVSVSVPPTPFDAIADRSKDSARLKFLRETQGLRPVQLTRFYVAEQNQRILRNLINQIMVDSFVMCLWTFVVDTGAFLIKRDTQELMELVGTFAQVYHSDHKMPIKRDMHLHEVGDITLCTLRLMQAIERGVDIGAALHQDFEKKVRATTMPPSEPMKAFPKALLEDIYLKSVRCMKTKSFPRASEKIPSYLFNRVYAESNALVSYGDVLPRRHRALLTVDCLFFCDEANPSPSFCVPISKISVFAEDESMPKTIHISSVSQRRDVGSVNIITISGGIGMGEKRYECVIMKLETANDCRTWLDALSRRAWQQRWGKQRLDVSIFMKSIQKMDDDQSEKESYDQIKSFASTSFNI